MAHAQLLTIDPAGPQIAPRPDTPYTKGLRNAILSPFGAPERMSASGRAFLTGYACHRWLGAGDLDAIAASSRPATSG
jgi:hypothetical protein